MNSVVVYKTEHIVLLFPTHIFWCQVLDFKCVHELSVQAGNGTSIFIKTSSISVTLRVMPCHILPLRRDLYNGDDCTGGVDSPFILNPLFTNVAQEKKAN